MPQNAVSILRVSTKKQLNEGEGIENQRRGNAEYIRRRGYRLAREFVIAESADGPDREDFESALAQVIADRAATDVVVFWKVDRISRGGVLPYYTVKGVLAKHGIRVEFATEQIDGSATGELMETLLAGMARFENRLRVERTIGVEKILTKAGYWCRGAPTGFRNARSDGKPVLLPTDDPGQWELLRAGLQKQLSGAYTLAEVAGEMRRGGLQTSRGNPVGKQTWINICRAPVYGGLLRGEWTDGAFVRARFDGPLTPDEWTDLQRVLDGKKRVGAPVPRRQVHPDFPLRRFLLCPGCGRTARGYVSVGRSGRAFGYYDCKEPACGFRVSRADAHAAFVGLLRRVRPAEPLLALFRELVLGAWDTKLQELAAQRSAGRASAGGLEEEKARLLALMKRNADRPGILGELERDFERVEGALSLARLGDGQEDFERYDREQVVGECVDAISRVVELWQEWPVEAKIRIQRLVFPQGIDYAAVIGNRTPQLSLLYAVIPGSIASKSNMAPPTCPVSNFSLLEELIRWFNVLKTLPGRGAISAAA
ncbi:MAG TPA: recombinase family protein [Urbifossiella sp.]|nr:recombinase family protein [Urbifossiella sp.]